MSDGSKQVAPKRARLSTSLTILAGECKKDLPHSVLKAPEVQAAIARGALRVEKPNAKKAPEAPKPAHSLAHEPEGEEPKRMTPRRGGKKS